MRPLAILLAGALAGLLAAQGCSSHSGWIGPWPDAGDGDGDVDSDSDVDGDGDTDVDSDSDADPGYCGDGRCRGWENANNCPMDCPAICGDGFCTHWEDEWSCPFDCGSTEECYPTDVVEGTGCFDGEKCALFSRDGVRWDFGCVPLYPGDVAGPGELCTAISDPYFGIYDNCVGGYFCSQDPFLEDFTCQKLCTDGDRRQCVDAYPDEAGALTRDGICIFDLGADMPIRGLMLCAGGTGCDPNCQDCSPARPDLACYVASDGISDATLCVEFYRSRPGPGITGDGCDFVNECMPGYMCVGGECRPFCDLRGETDCEWSACGRHEGSAEGSCVPFEELGFPVDEHPALGICIE